MSVFNDLRQFKNPESPTSVDGNFNYGHIPNNPSGSAILDPGSFQPTPSVAARTFPRRRRGAGPRQQHTDDQR